MTLSTSRWKLAAAPLVLLAVMQVAACGSDDSPEGQAALTTCKQTVGDYMRQFWSDPDSDSDVALADVKIKKQGDTPEDHPFFEITGRVGIFKFKCSEVTVVPGSGWDGRVFYADVDGQLITNIGQS